MELGLGPKNHLQLVLVIKVSEKTRNVPKNFAHSKAGSVGSLEMTFFGILKIGPLELIYVIYD